MKVLQLTSHFSPNIGGVETHLDDLISSLIKRNNEVFVLTYRPLTTEAKWNIYEKRKSLQILRLPWFPGFFYQLVNNPILEFLYLLPGLFLITPFVLLKEDPNIVHTHGLVAGFVGLVWGKIFRKRVIVTLHNIYHFPHVGLYYQFTRWIFNHADAVLCISQQSALEVEDLGIAKNKIQVFTYWIDLKKFVHVSDARKKIEVATKFTVLFVGRLIEEKGIIEILESAKQFPKNVQLLIAGTGPLEENIKNQVSKNKEQKIKNIVFLGKIDNNKLPLYYSAADVLIVPSVHEEGFGRVILESLACGTPVIGSKRGGIVEALNLEVGYLIDITSENIVKAVTYCLTHQQNLQEKSKKAVIYAKKHFSETNINAILNTYGEA